MSVTLEHRDRDCLIRLQGPLGLASAAELKTVLLDWLAAGKDLELDLQAVGEIDLTALQLIHAAAREGSRAGVQIRVQASGQVVAAACDAGFSHSQGFPIRE